MPFIRYINIVGVQQGVQGSEFEFALDRHFRGIEVLRYRETPDLRHESDALVFGVELIGSWEHENDSGEPSILRQQIHAGSPPVLLTLAAKERVFLQRERQSLLIDIHAGNIVNGHSITAAFQIRRVFLMSFQFGGADRTRAFPTDLKSGEMNGPALSGRRWPDASKSGRIKSLDPDTIASSHLAALAALSFVFRRHQNRSHFLDPRRVGENQLGILFGPLLRLLSLPGRSGRHQQHHRERKNHGFQYCLHGLYNLPKNSPRPGSFRKPSHGFKKMSATNAPSQLDHEGENKPALLLDQIRLPHAAIVPAQAFRQHRGS